MITKPLGLYGSLAYFGGGAVLLFLMTHIGMTATAVHFDGEPILLWFAFGGLGVFLPLIIAALFLLRREGKPFTSTALLQRMRFTRMSVQDWFWGIGGLIAVYVGSGIMAGLLTAIFGDISMSPPFMHMEPLPPGRYWILAIWLPFWLLNILGEEILWRGVLLPRQEAALGSKAWILHGAGWLLFHIAFGWTLVVTLIPIVLILPWIVQKRGNSWIGVLIHAGLNGPGFIAVAFGWV